MSRWRASWTWSAAPRSIRRSPPSGSTPAIRSCCITVPRQRPRPHSRVHLRGVRDHRRVRASRGRRGRLPRDRARAHRAPVRPRRVRRAFEADFEAFLQSADSDPQTDGIQPYRDPYGQPILTLARTHFSVRRRPGRASSRTIPTSTSGTGSTLRWTRPVSRAWARVARRRRLAAAVLERDAPREPRHPHQRARGADTVGPASRVDQLGTSRPSTGESDIGAIELR